MIRAIKLTTTITAGVVLLWASSAVAVPITTIFGSDNAGYGGFTTGATVPTTTPAPAWTLGTQGAIFTNAPTDPAPNPDTGQVNSSLLREFILDRTAGNSYTITGVVDWTSSYANDNNRLGISLFATSAALAGIDTGLSLQANIGAATNNLIIRQGVNGTSTSSATISIPRANLIGQTLVYTATIDFVGSDIDIGFTLAAPDLSYSQTINATVAAASYTGDHFGFGSRGRVRDGNADFIYEAQSFAVVPEPSTVLLLSAAGLGGLALLRRRCRK